MPLELTEQQVVLEAEIRELKNRSHSLETRLLEELAQVAEVRHPGGSIEDQAETVEIRRKSMKIQGNPWKSMEIAGSRAMADWCSCLRQLETLRRSGGADAAAQRTALRGPWARVMALHRALHLRGLERSGGTESALGFACRLRWRLAVELWWSRERQGIEASGVASEAMLLALELGGQWRWALGTKVSARSCAREGPWEGALGLLEGLSVSGTEVDQQTWNAGGHALGMESAWVKVLELSKQGRDEATLTNLVRACDKEWCKALGYLQDARTRPGCTTTISTIVITTIIIIIIIMVVIVSCRRQGLPWRGLDLVQCLDVRVRRGAMAPLLGSAPAPVTWLRPTWSPWFIASLIQQSPYEARGIHSQQPHHLQLGRRRLRRPMATICEDHRTDDGS